MSKDVSLNQRRAALYTTIIWAALTAISYAFIIYKRDGSDPHYNGVYARFSRMIINASVVSTITGSIYAFYIKKNNINSCSICIYFALPFTAITTAFMIYIINTYDDVNIIVINVIVNPAIIFTYIILLFSLWRMYANRCRIIAFKSAAKYYLIFVALFGWSVIVNTIR